MLGLATCKVISNPGVCKLTIYVSFTGEPAKPTNVTSPHWSPSLYLEQTDEAIQNENAIRLVDPEGDRPGPPTLMQNQRVTPTPTLKTVTWTLLGLNVQVSMPLLPCLSAVVNDIRNRFPIIWIEFIVSRTSIRL